MRDNGAVKVLTFVPNRVQFPVAVAAGRRVALPTCKKKRQKRKTKAPLANKQSSGVAIPFPFDVRPKLARRRTGAGKVGNIGFGRKRARGETGPHSESEYPLSIRRARLNSLTLTTIRSV